MRGLHERRILGSIILCCLCIIVLTRCITPYEPSETTSSKGLLVIEAYIIAPIGSSIKISKSIGLQDPSDYEKVSNAKITIISDKGDIIANAYEYQAGEYLINTPIAFLPDTKYALDIVIGNTHLQSVFEEPLITPQIDELTWASKSDGYEVDILLSTHDPLQKTKYYLWRYEENWEYTAPLYTEDRWDPNRRRVVSTTNTDNVFYCWNNSYSKSLILGNTQTLQAGVLKNKIIANLKSGDTRFSHLYSILVKQYAVPYEAYKYYENLYTNVNESGSLFAPMPTEMEGNIKNLTNPDEPVIGYALLSTETTDRIYIYGKDVPLMNKKTGAECQIGPEPEDDVSTPEKAYQAGWGISLKDDNRYEYRRLNCLDCRLGGGNKNKPYFWPTNHF